MDRFPGHDRYPSGDHPDDALPIEPVDEAEAIGPILEDRTSPAPAATFRIGGRAGLSLPAAIGAAVLVTTVAFGAAAFQAAKTPDAGRETATVEPNKDPADRPDATSDATSDAKPDDMDEPTGKPDGSDAKPDTEPTPATDRAGEGDLKPVDEAAPTTAPKPTPKPESMPKPTPKPEAKPTPKPEPKPTPKPEPGVLEIALRFGDGGRVVVDWSAYLGDGFGYYKVVRSTDATVAWPAGENDTVIGATEDPGSTAMKDGAPIAGQYNFYRVFAVRKAESGYQVLAATKVAKIAVPADKPVPTPEPSAMWIEAEVTDAGVALHWEACGTDGFVAYKIVRSQGSNPSYLPGTDGSQVLAAIGEAGTTSFSDGDVASGQTWWYRVQSIGHVDDQKVLLGQTEAIKVVVP